MAAPPVLLLNNIHLTFGANPLLQGTELAVSPGDRVALVGRNGSGKSTLLKIAAGLITQDDGTRFMQPGVTVRYLPQEPDLSAYKTTLDYVEEGLGPSDDPHRARHLLEQLGMTGTEDPRRLSGGESRRCALARTLAPDPDILLLDEPTNHLDLPAIEWLEAELAASRAAIVLISHDRRLLTDLSRAVVWIDRGMARRMERGFGEFEEWRDRTLEEEQVEQHKLARQIVREEHWMRYGVTARRKRNVRRVAELADLRRTHREFRAAAGSVKMQAAAAETSGKIVVEAKGITKRYGDRAIVEDFSLNILRGDRIAIVGPNGAGKTTLLNMMIGKLTPDEGSVKLGASLTMVTLDQQRATLDPNATLSDTLTGGGGDMVDVAGQKRHVIGYMKDFLFAPEQARTAVSVLSGGERGRLLLACALTQKCNLLVLDEPTNDLDLETLDLLEEVLADHPGTVILVSHDRDFIDRVATATIASDSAGRWMVYAGGYSDMLSQRGEAPAGKFITRSPAARKAAQAERGKGASRKLSFKDQHALTTLPGQMEKVQQHIAKLQEELSDPTLYRRNAVRFAQASTLLSKREKDLADAEERWLDLEMKREELGG